MHLIGFGLKAGFYRICKLKDLEEMGKEDYFYFFKKPYLGKTIKLALAITGTANAVSVAEHVMTMFLNICKMSKLSDQLVRDGKFIEKNSLPDCFELYKKNILIIGFGRIGKALAKRCFGFDSKVYVYDPFIDTSIINNNN